MTAPLWRRRAVLLSGLGLAAASLSSQVRLSRQRQADANAPTSSTQKGFASELDPEGSQPGAKGPLRLGWSPWADAEVMSLIAQRVIQQAYNLPVERVMADIGIQYASVARGDLDLMLMAWLPLTHKDYWTRVRDRVLDFGSMYSGRLGWVVPDYVDASELRSIADLRKPELAARFDNTVQGIDPGSGLNQASEQALVDYNLGDMRLVASSSAAMTAVLDKAIREQRWVVVTSWTPHWMFARYKLRFLEDPQLVFGGVEWIHALGRKGLDRDYPDLAGFLSRFQIPDRELSDLLLMANERSADVAVEDYLDRHPARIRYWTTGMIS
ncbi:glycine betaine ABC transporter substrate-binding protein [bacterium]|nr:glycine betaine ABC transporter substrate-binding protein [bacterium]